MTQAERIKVNDYIVRSFRDTADNDYVSARCLYRLGLSQQFLWAALQTLEKYLKAILLFNDVSTKNLNHNISAAYSKLKQIGDISFDIPSDVEKFISYLSKQGANRYFERPFYTRGEELLELDRAVWYLRRYCQYLQGEFALPNGSKIARFPIKLDEIQCAQTIKHPERFKIFAGHLEKLLSKSSRVRDELVWKNFYFGTYKKKVITNFTLATASAIPTNFIHPEIFSLLNTKIHFSKEVADHFKPLVSP